VNDEQKLQQALELHQRHVYHHFGIDKKWVQEVAFNESMTAQFGRDASVMITNSVIEELSKIKFPRSAFRILADESPVNFIIAVLAFVDRMKVPEGQTTTEYLTTQKSPLIAFCAILIAGAEQAGQSQEILARISKRLPDEEPAQALIKNVDFGDNTVDWTQYMIDNIDKYAVYKEDSETPTVH
jgi:hypothetical protein